MKTILRLLNPLKERYLQELPKPVAVLNAENTGGKIQLAWKPCRISYSPVYPFWKVEVNNKIFYVDTKNNVYDAIPVGRKG